MRRVPLVVFVVVAVWGSVGVAGDLQTDLDKQVVSLLEPYADGIRRGWVELAGVGGPMAYEEGMRKGGQGVMADFIGCDLCRPAVTLVRGLIAIGVSDDLIQNAIIVACVVLDLAPHPNICGPTIRSYTDSILYIVRNKTPEELSMADFCGIINPGCEEIAEPLRNWTVTVDLNKPQRKPRPSVPSSGGLVTAIQFTDIHLDLDYVEGRNASCGLPICCRDGKLFNDPEMIDDPTDVGGPFGAVSCGLPEAALSAMLKHAAETYKDAGMIFLTGDYVHSGVWLYNETENSRHIKAVVDLVRAHFPSTPVFPLVGNHEPGVVNMYTPPDLWGEDESFDLAWMYDAVAGPFESHMGGPAEVARFKKFGYYTAKPAGYSNLRLIVLNTNICYTNNFWLPYDAVDTNGQLQWFADTLDLAEGAGDEVLILGHIQPGSGSCWPVWSNQFDLIVNRYEGIIHGMWFGHSHESYYKLTMDRDEDRPTAVSFVGGSALTDGMNSGYSVYHLDGGRGDDSTWEVVNHEAWILKLNESNAGGGAVFERTLDARRDYGVERVGPVEVYDLVFRMACDNNLLRKYQEVMVKGEDSPRWKGACVERECKVGILGDMVGSNSDEGGRGAVVERYLRGVYCGEGGVVRPAPLLAFFLLLTAAYGCVFNKVNLVSLL